MSSSSTPPSSPPMSPRTIVPPMTPTKAPITSTQATRILGEFHDSTTDQDPSEWKPRLCARPDAPSQGRTPELSQFVHAVG
ncbi:hypothetical protein APSETT444_004504 [Aspergillus pseudonomiae]